MSRWRVTLEAMPYSTGQGADVDMKASGPRVREHTFDAPEFHDAVKIAYAFQAGVKSSDHVWEAPIQQLVRVK